MNISLPAELKKWVETRVTKGGYGTASEFVRDVLRQARARELKTGINTMLTEAADSGATTNMDDADWSEIRAAARAQVKQPRRRKSA